MSTAGETESIFWPNSTVEYEYPARTTSNEQKWRDAIRSSLESGRLELAPSDDSTGDFYNLTGQCPRCGHLMDQTIEFGVILGALPLSARFGIFNVQCNCRHPHQGRDDKYKGCGWGGALDVPLSTSR